MVRACSTYGERRDAYRIVGGRKPEVKRPLWRPRRRWEDNIKMDLQEVGWGYGLDRAGSGQERVAGICECGNESSGPVTGPVWPRGFQEV
jgi:hypothetical protein